MDGGANSLFFTWTYLKKIYHFHQIRKSLELTEQINYSKHKKETTQTVISLKMSVNESYSTSWTRNSSEALTHIVMFFHKWIEWKKEYSKSLSYEFPRGAGMEPSISTNFCYWHTSSLIEIVPTKTKNVCNSSMCNNS